MLKDRIKKVRKHLNIGSQKKFSEITELSIGRVQDLESGKVKELKSFEAELLQEKFLINGWWLMTGKGEMLLKEGCGESIQANDTVQVNYYEDIHASAGYGASNGSAGAIPMSLSKNFLMTFFGLTSFTGLEAINVIGDSMEPFLHHGETILLQRTREVRNNQIVVIRVEDELYVKRLIKTPFSNTMRLTSENDFYPDKEITQEQFKNMEIIGVVRGSFRPR